MVGRAICLLSLNKKGRLSPAGGRGAGSDLSEELCPRRRSTILARTYDVDR
jgi:hypothetical protein